MKNFLNYLKKYNNYFWILLAIANFVLVIFILNSMSKKNTEPSFPTIDPSPTEIVFQVTEPVINQGSNSISPSPTQTISNKSQQTPLFILSIFVNQKSQLYIYHPDKIPFTRLLNEPYEEIHPSISHDQQKLAYSAKKNGYWDIYILDLKTGDETRVTDTPEYEGTPTWSSDGLFLAYESYKNGNLDIFIQDIVNLETQPIQLTNSDNPQFSPSWSPKGRDIAYVSTLSGDEEIWLANLDSVENRFTKISDQPDQIDLNPKWSEDGEKLLWSSEKNGYPTILMKDFSVSNQPITDLGIGDSAILAAAHLTYIQKEANQNFLISKNLSDGLFAFPSISLPGNINGFVTLSNYEDKKFLQESIETNPVYFPDQQISGNNEIDNNKRVGLDSLINVDTKFPFLNESVIANFNQLRSKIAAESGWDFLNQIQRTFIPITEPATPGTAEEWLYTGRAFEFNPLSIHAGLTTTIKEERNGQTYWRIYIKSRYQDGSQGMPLKQMPFDLSARYNNDPLTYDAGGIRVPIPDGYWIDLTELALSFSWERLPAIGNWQRYFDSARFNQFVLTNGLDWYAAMKELYPVEAFKTPTPIPTNPLTPTISPTIRFYRSPTLTLTPTETLIPTRRPTWTPNP
jgi:TolB protein